ncbi:MAG: MBL fold metallo-hydrolase [Sulfolobales archaeon]|nr:MBL fold metallo-hydrolase [Sulfolobales archaeon]MCX8198742.1 MBL fold metallo-hydrolase [Sulfolobales archaeon]MDW8169815.1 MBL fold metallo-hydrolase [Desulfurococcaceae archaeon]
MELAWHGHAFFTLRLARGYVIAIDPHDGLSIGLKRVRVESDLVLVTHDHFDHNAVEVVKKPSTRILKQFYGEVGVDDIIVNGIKTFHDKHSGARRGENAVYAISTEGLKIAHLGDLGHVLSGEALSKLSKIDILMIPVGGTYTIEPDEAWSIVKNISPRIVIPMHYWVKGLRLPLKTVDHFLKYAEGVHVSKLDTNLMSITPSNLPLETTVIVFKYP